jgi:DnaJ-class molecular chaperone
MNVVPCSKCKGTGKFQYNSGMIGQCYNCDGIGKLKQTERKQYGISIIDTNGERIKWTTVTANTEPEAIRKAEKIAIRGVYKDNINTIQATEKGVTFKYSKIKK